MSPKSLLRSSCKCLLLLLIILTPNLLLAQRLMEDFKPVIKGYPVINEFEIDENDNLFLAGRIVTVGNNLVSNVAKINPLGTADEAFDLDAELSYQFEGLIISPDSVILYINNSKLFVSKKDGSSEPFFSPSAAFYDVQAAAIKDDKYVIIAYQVNSGTSNYKLLYLNRDGTIDSGLSTHSLEILSFPKIKVLDDGRVLLAGIKTFDGETSGTIIRLNADGDLDDSFENDNTLNGIIEDIEVQPDGKILVAGRFRQFNSSSTAGGLIRLNTDGSIDQSFQLGDIESEFVYYPTSIEVIEDEKLIIGGLTRSENFRNFNKIIRLDSDGRLDETFPILIVERLSSGRFFVKVASDGTIFAAGDVNGSDDTIRPGLIAFDANGGILDFNAKVGGVPGITDGIIQEDGKLVICGGFYQVNDATAYGICRLNPDGSLDNSFNIDIDFSQPRKNSASRLGLQSDGKIIVSGVFNLDEPDTWYKLLRITESGTIDESFQKTDGDFNIKTIHVNESDEIYIGGDFTQINGAAINSLAKLTNGGNLISGFNSSNSIPSASNLNDILFLENGEMIVTGTLSSLDGFVYKLSSEGNFVSSVPSSHLENNYINFAEVTGDKLIFGGSLSSGSSIDEISIFQSDTNLESIDGSLIKAQNGLANSFSKAFTTGNDEVIIGGSFNNLNGIVRTSLVQTTLSGQVSDQFVFDLKSSPGSSGTVFDLIQEDQETMIVVGSFTGINDVLLSGIARIKFLNDSPKINSFGKTLSTAEEGLVEITLEDFFISDEDDNFPEEFTLVILEGENYSVSGNKVSPGLDFYGTLTVPVKVSDGKDESETYNLSIEVTPMNDTPVISGLAGPLSLDENTSLTLSLENFIVADPDNTFPDDFTLILAEGDNYTIDGAAVIPKPGFFGTLMVKAKVSDGESTSDVFDAEVTVVSTNVAPVIDVSTSSVSTPEETALTISLASLSVTDPDNTFPDDFTLSIGAGNNYTVAGTTITPATDFNGTLTVPVKVNDSEADSPGYKLSVAVTPINDVPVITAYTGTVVGNEDTPLTFSLDGISVTDPDNSFPADFSFSLEAGDNYTVDGASILPALNYSGSLSVAAKVSDGAANSAPYLIAVTIQAVNDAPVISGYSGTLSTPEETALTIDLTSLTVADPDNSFPADFTLTILDGDNYTVADSEVTPAENFSGSINVPVTVSDGSDNSQAFNLTIEVAPVNDAPVITGYSGPLEMDENTLLSLALEDFTVADPDNEFPTEFTLNLNPGENYTTEGTTIVPDTNFSGELSVGVVVSDGMATSKPFGLTFTVNEVTGILDLDSEISLFPVPVTSELSLRIDNNYQGVVMLNLTDLSGNSILTKRLTKKGQTFESVVDVRPVPRGLYIVEIEIPGKGIVSKRVVVE